MVIVTPEDLRRVEHLEHELADAGREAERVAVHKALTLLRREAIERFEVAVNAPTLPRGVLPDRGDPPFRALSEAQAARLAILQEANRQRRLTSQESRELQTLLKRAESGAMQNVMALLRDHNPDADTYLRALRAYRRSFSRSGVKKTKGRRSASPPVGH